MWRSQEADRRKRESSESLEYSPNPEVKASLHANGVVFLHVVTGMVMSSNPVGARIWREAAQGTRLDLIVADISREFAVPEAVVWCDAEGFLRELQIAGILTRAERNHVQPG